ncbi:ABC transporter permease [Pleionea mediterranea]|uniref:Transport permease protein n=1 Tax=Pleionea mediterranea TaxID=523701 RepID=A0A316GG13_9GAMM|nr:ABC transporter permease [Pleionea mediterranea]PWK53637.1 ABC-2 type transport system permease protein [Pleionea mediterranea]
MKTDSALYTSKTHLFGIYYYETRAEFLKAMRMPAFAIPSLLFPLMFYIFFGLIFNQSAMNGQMPSYLMATYGVFGVIGPALFSFGVGVSIEKDQGWLAMKQCSPMPISAYFIARILSAMVFGVLIILGLFLLGAIFGDVAMHTWQWLLTMTVLLAGMLPFCALGLWFGLLAKSQAAPAIVNLIYLPMAFLSGLWLPIQLFPEIMQNTAWMFPAFHLAQLTLAIQGLDSGIGVLWHLTILLVMTVIFLFLATRAFRHQAEK